MVIFGGSWRALAGRGAVALALGAFASVVPVTNLWSATVLFGVYAVADGLMAIAVGLGNRAQRHGWFLGLDGAIGVGFGVTAMGYPPARLHDLVLLIVIWAVASGVLEVAASLRMRGLVPGEVMLLAAGLTSVLLGVYLLLREVRSTEDLVRLLAVYAALFGAALLLLAIRIRRVHLLQRGARLARTCSAPG